MTIVGTRPELIKMSLVIKELEQHTRHVLVHTGQNYDYELNQIFFEEMNIRKPDHFLNAVGRNAAQSIASIIEKADEVLELEKPDAVMLYGDTNSCLSVIAAKRRKIPVFHMEAGNRCFDQRVPEELNRKIVDHLSDINMVLTEHARRYLIAEGIKPETIIKTGSHMKEVLKYYEPMIENSSVLDALELDAGKYFIVSFHREENVDNENNLRDLLDTLNALAETYNIPVIVSTHPRTHQRLAEIADIKLDDRIKFLKPFGLIDYIKLQSEAFCVISDSGTVTEESSLLCFPAITIRNAHERPEGMDAGTLIMSGLKRKRVLSSVHTITTHAKMAAHESVTDYSSDLVSKKVVRIVLSYVDYVNRTVWSKH